MNMQNNSKKNIYNDFGAPGANPGAINTIDDCNRLIYSIRDRPLKTITGLWLNIIEYRGHQFIQGDIRNETDPDGNLTPIAALADGVQAKDIAGFWPEVSGYPIHKSEGDRIASYLARQGKNDVELIVPERNALRPPLWGRFDESPEFELYREFIYPAIIEAIEEIGGHRDPFKVCL